MCSLFVATRASKEAILGGVSVGSRHGDSVEVSITRRFSKRSFSSVAAADPGGSIEERIHGYTKVGIEKYHIQHLRDLVAPGSPIQSWVNICSTRSLNATRGSRVNPSARFSRPRRVST